MSTQSTNIRIDTELKRQAQQLFSDLGMDMTTAVNIFLCGSRRSRFASASLRLVLAWIVLHEEELYAAWNKAVRNLPIDKIEPLK